MQACARASRCHVYLFLRRGALHRGTSAKAQQSCENCRQFTINLHKLLHGITFKKRAPRAIREARACALPGRACASGDVCGCAVPGPGAAPARGGRALTQPTARRQVKKFATKAMKTKDVRLDVKLNKALWAKGIRNVRAKPGPCRLRPALAPTPPVSAAGAAPHSRADSAQAQRRRGREGALNLFACLQIVADPPPLLLFPAKRRVTHSFSQAVLCSSRSVLPPPGGAVLLCHRG